MNTTVVSNPKVGPLVRDWRMRRRRSQMDLALDVGMSARHLSFVETGRSKPSPELLLVLADRLDVPLREQNQMLVAAGYAPVTRRRRWTTAPWAAPELQSSGCSTTTIPTQGWRSTGRGT